MVHCTVGFCFHGDVENGGDGFLIGAHRCAAFQVPQRDIYFSSKNPVTGRTVFKGNKIKHAKGNPYLVDCTVTGTNAGTAYSPNFPLRQLWEHSLIPSIKALIAPGGPCAGATVVFQEDNAGPHTEHEYASWMQTTFQDLGWKVELQAPQGTFSNIYETLLYAHVYCLMFFYCTGPYTNVLDLYLFPSMSHRHNSMLQICNNTEANKEQTWKTVQAVWKDTSSSEVARSFVLAYRVMRLIIEENGNNSWLAHGTPHCNVRNDYVNTLTGIKPKTKPTQTADL